MARNFPNNVEVLSSVSQTARRFGLLQVKVNLRELLTYLRMPRVAEMSTFHLCVLQLV
jgi:hypothetical protein